MRPPILLLHGALGASCQMAKIAEKLSAKYTVYTFDLPGHGGKPMPAEPFSIQLFAEAVYEFIEAKNIRCCTVFGYSMGGYIAMYLVHRHPGIFEKLITLGTKFHWDEATAAKEKKMMDAETISVKLPAFAASLEKMHAPNDWKILLKRSADMLEEIGKSNPLELPDYSSIQTASLIMLGDRDKMVTMEETVNVYKTLPLSEFAVLPGTTHPIEQLDVELLNFLITTF